MLDKNKIDLSIPYNQNVLINTFYEYYQISELEQLDIETIKCPADNFATQACNNMDYTKVFEDTKSSFKIKCVLDVNSLPPTHHTRLEFNKEDIYRISMECNPDHRNPYYLFLIIIKAINFSKYRSHKDTYYNRRSVINGVAKRAAQIVPDFNVLIYFRGRMAQELYLTEDYKKMKDGDVFEKEYEGGYRLLIRCCYRDILKVELYNKDGKMDYSYFPKSDLGMNEGLLVLDKAIVRLKDDMIESIGNQEERQMIEDATCED